MKRVCGTLVLLVSLATTTLSDPGDQRVKRQMAPNCSPDLMKNLLKCCTIPTPFTTELMSGCSAGKLKTIAINLKNAARITGQRVAQASSKVGANFRSLKNFASNVTGEIKNAAKMMSSTGPVCAFECMFRNKSMLASDGKVDTAAASAAFIASAPDSWKAAMTAATANCSATLNDFYKKANSSGMPSLPTGACKPCSMLYTGCIQRNLILNCPNFSNGGTCAADFEKLKSCASDMVKIF